MDAFLNFGSVVVCRWDGFAVCAIAARVATRRSGCPVAHKVRFCRGLSQERGDPDHTSRLLHRVIISSQYSTVWPKVLTGGSSVCINSRSCGERMLIDVFRRRTRFSSWWRCCYPSRRMPVIHMGISGRFCRVIPLLRSTRYHLLLWNKRKACSHHL